MWGCFPKLLQSPSSALETSLQEKALAEGRGLPTCSPGEGTAPRASSQGSWPVLSHQQKFQKVRRGREKKTGKKKEERFRDEKTSRLVQPAPGEHQLLGFSSRFHSNTIWCSLEELAPPSTSS